MRAGVESGPAEQRGPRQLDHAVELLVIGPHPLDLAAGPGE
ncbi:hypothetical protein [Streptomyces sp. NPDC047525]